MGCGSCTTGACSTGGCGQKGGCKTGGCNKMNAYDWFDSMQQPTQSEFNNVYEIRFKNTRKEFFRNANGLSLITGDFVAVESDRGFDVGQISLGGILAQLQMRKKKVRGGLDKVKKIYRRATKEDLEKLQLARSREHETLVRSREIVRILNLDMKMSEVEYQGDNTKAIFYYISDQRVDFRELIKLLAGEFKIRIEMKQIGLRFESALVGGIGSCGRELCCATWLSDFKTVSTAAARYQNLSLNPMKISGQCGRLKCCLNFELDSYLDALKDIPKVDRIETEMGMAFLQKTDIFKRTLWFSYAGESTWIAMEADKVMEMAAMNKKGIRPASLHSLDKEIAEEDKEADFVDVVGQSIPREDPKRKKKKKKKPGQEGTSNANRPREARVESGTPGSEGEAPRVEGQDQRGPRPQNQQPRDGQRQQGGRDNRGPRPQNQQKQGGPRPEGQENRGPRPEGQQRQGGPRPEGQENRGPRPQNQQKQGGPRPEGKENRGPRPENQGKQQGPRPENKDQRGPKPQQPPRNEGNPQEQQPRREQGPRPEQKPRNEGGQNQNTSGRDFRKIAKKPSNDRPGQGPDGGGNSNPPANS
ncbi:MAG: Signal peptidase-like protein [Bacteroidetes bacterium]|nr:Signal peptidase-like protein [Bacteroidota bacterium]